MTRFLLRAMLTAFVVAVLYGCAGRPPAQPPAITGAACLADLGHRAVVFRAIDLGQSKDPRCRVDTPVRVTQIEVPLNQPAAMSCPLAARFATFEHAAVQKLALADLGHYVVRIDHLGAYSCRGSTGRHDRMSEHAYGLAIDISGSLLSDGTRVSVERDWAPPGPKRDFLHHLARDACGFFSVVLTPDSSAEHYNHLHFDIGPDRFCAA